MTNLLTIENTKNEMIKFLQQNEISFNAKMKKNELFDLIEKFENSKNEIVVNEIVLLNEMNETLTNEKFNHFDEIAIIENIENENIENENVSNFETIKNEYIEFLNNHNCIYNFDNDIFHVNANKKQIFVKLIENDNDIHFYVFTILNNKFSNDMKQNKLFARNILTLKSLKACKSYTISNIK